MASACCAWCFSARTPAATPDLAARELEQAEEFLDAACRRLGSLPDDPQAEAP
jgi:hypothetical protein